MVKLQAQDTTLNIAFHVVDGQDDGDLDGVTGAHACSRPALVLFAMHPAFL